MTAKPMPDMATPRKIFSYPIHIAEVPQGGLDVAIEADAAALQALAEADGLPHIDRLEANFHVVPEANQKFNVSGEVRARVTQICVVSLEPFESEVVEPIDVDFAPADAIEAASSSSVLLGGGAAQLAQERDPPDPIIDGKIDLGVLAAEFLALGLDPYPKKPGVNFEAAAPQDDSPAEPADESPFGVLRKLKERS